MIENLDHRSQSPGIESMDSFEKSIKKRSENV